MYANGLGVSRNEEEALHWYRRSAEQGVALAQFNLGLMYANGLGADRDYEQAGAWFRKAAEQGITAGKIFV